MLEILGNRLQKAIAKAKAKTSLNESDILEVSREIKMALLEADVNLLVVKQFVKSIKSKVLETELTKKLNPSQQMIKIVKEELVNILGKEVKNVEFIGKMPIVMMTGLQGSGKTTTSAKIAKFFIKKKHSNKPLIIAADVYRPAAVDQLISLGKQININVYHETTKNNPWDIVKNGIEYAKKNDYDLVLIDTAGRLSIDTKLMDELILIKKVSNPQEILFVTDSLVGQDVINVAKTFHEKIQLTGTIITKFDSDARGGAALSITSLLQLPIKFIGTGEKINALELFYPDRIANRILGMGDVISLIEKVEENINEKKSHKLINRMISGHFDLDDLMTQLSQVKKIGKFSKILKMIPGASNKISSNQINKIEDKIKLYEFLISSMTKKERKNPKLLKNPNRKKRIINGSGRSNQDYNSLINDFDKMSKQIRVISKSIKDGTFNPGMLGGL